MNLLDNAIKFSHKNSEIAISIWESEQAINISIDDKGVSIKKEFSERLFERFYSVDKARSRKLGGI